MLIHAYFIRFMASVDQPFKNPFESKSLDHLLYRFTSVRLRKLPGMGILKSTGAYQRTSSQRLVMKTWRWCLDIE